MTDANCGKHGKKHILDYANEIQKDISPTKIEFHTPCKNCSFVQISEAWKP